MNEKPLPPLSRFAEELMDAMRFYEEHKNETREMRIRLALREGKITEERAARLLHEMPSEAIH